uniref:NADH dehydrogenase subunit 6 n=1 Tax=Tolmerinus auronotatus TaxID=2977785 RepID=UPI0021CC5F26|nr:NADH dehydrogenase subunit 6 [Tolmerinus auronotatus]UWM92596.1 NADH dehydrogenase subunit 6 [Tolmerinus auronotatus]
MIMLMILLMTFSLSFIFLNHPMSMGLILLIQTILVTLIMGFMSMNYWFSYILFLIMIGGMLVLFTYMTSIASNEKFKFSKLLFWFISLMFIVMSMTLIFDYSFFNLINYSNDFSSNFMFNINLNKFLNYPSNIILFMMIIYLFITLIAVVKITDIKFGALRQKF